MAFFLCLRAGKCASSLLVLSLPMQCAAFRVEVSFLCLFSAFWRLSLSLPSFVVPKVMNEPTFFRKNCSINIDLVCLRRRWVRYLPKSHRGLESPFMFYHLQFIHTTVTGLFNPYLNHASYRDVRTNNLGKRIDSGKHYGINGIILGRFHGNTLYAAEQKVLGDFLNTPPNSVPFIKLQMKN